MLKRTSTLILTAALFGGAVRAQQPAAKAPVHENDYSVSREGAIQGKVVEYTANARTAPVGARLKLQTSAGVVDVHLGNPRLLTANHLTLAAGDSVTVRGENIPFGGGTFYAARVIQKGNTTVTLRSKNGMPLLLTRRTTNGSQTAGAR
jgi:hypothetical protein